MTLTLGNMSQMSHVLEQKAQPFPVSKDPPPSYPAMHEHRCSLGHSTSNPNMIKAFCKYDMLNI